jgi:NADH-quinone oxidoreductase subunit G
MPTVEIDGRPIAVEDGVTVIQAAERLGIEIPHYCWHPGLSIAGNCRMCLVEIEKQPKLQIACNTRVTDGMVVSTTSERTKAAQRAVLEFLLVNHPIDCPVCDQAGECKLQEYYMDYDRQRSRVEVEDKVRKRKAVPVGPLIMLDQERCILCARCTRFLDEVTQTHELAIFERGNHCEVALAPGKTLDNPYAGNVIDICPVGALTSRDFRFRARVWYLQKTDSVCGECATGCNIEIYHRQGQIYRFQPRANADVNQYWMCDAGRLSCHGLQGEARLMEVLARGPAGFAVATWGAALDAVEREVAAAGPGGVGVIASARSTNEELYLLGRFARRVGAVAAGLSWSPPGSTGDAFLVKADRNPNTTGLGWLGLAPGEALEAVLAGLEAGRIRVLVLHRTDLVTWGGAERMRQMLERAPYVVVLDTHASETAHYANLVLPIGTYAEVDGTFANHAGRVQRLRAAVAPPGHARPGWDVLRELLGRVEPGLTLGDPGAVFAAAASEVAALAGISYDALGVHGTAAGVALT